ASAESAVGIAEKEAAWARADAGAVAARIAADKAKYTEPPDPKTAELGEAARKAERQAVLLKGEAGLMRAQQKLAEALGGPAPTDERGDKAREKKVAAARKELQEAQSFLAKATESYTPLGKLYPKQSSGRRLALAQWIASRDNPLTARVAGNHIWMRHFGKPLVATPPHFGRGRALP